MNTTQLIKNVFNTLHKLGTNEVIACAGARNMPFIEALNFENFFVQSYFEERSAGFYALGRIKATGKPVAVIVTSGTAVAELLPAVIEAWYQQLPLVLITADRPKSYRGTGAPQTMNQYHLFESFVVGAFDWDVFSQLENCTVSTKGPLHFNICLDEPLKTETQVYADYRPIEHIQFSESYGHKNYQFHFAKNNGPLRKSKTLAIVGELNSTERSFVKSILLEKQIVHYCESLSGLQNDPELSKIQIRSSEHILSDLVTKDQSINIIRIGGVPTCRFWRDLENKFKNISIDHFSSRPFPGTSRISNLFQLLDLEYLDISQNLSFDHPQDQMMVSRKKEIIFNHPKSEQYFYSLLFNTVISNAIYVGNSLPIRIWDLVYTRWQNDINIFAHRGVNGIDGQISGYLGWAKDIPESWCVVGDLTALYDLAALGLAKNHQNKLRLVIMNNSGGQIFKRILGQSVYLNAQDVSFSGLATLWGWSYQKVMTADDLRKIKEIPDSKLIIEITPNETETQIVWKQLDQLWKNQ